MFIRKKVQSLKLALLNAYAELFARPDYRTTARSTTANAMMLRAYKGLRAGYVSFTRSEAVELACKKLGIDCDIDSISDFLTKR